MDRPKKANQMRTALQLLIPTVESVLGVDTKTWTEDLTFSCNFSTYGGTESVNNGILSVVDTAEIICWYNPRITGDCRVKRLSDGALFDIIGDPENLEMQNMLLKFKVRRVKGGV